MAGGKIYKPAQFISPETELKINPRGVAKSSGQM